MGHLCGSHLALLLKVNFTAYVVFLGGGHLSRGHSGPLEVGLQMCSSLESGSSHHGLVVKV